MTDTAEPTPSPADRRHITQSDADGRYVMHRHMIAWLGGSVVVLGAFALFVLDRAEEKAFVPVQAMELKVETAVRASTEAVADVSNLRSEVKQEISLLNEKVTKLGEANVKSNEAIVSKIDDLAKNVNRFAIDIALANNKK